MVEQNAELALSIASRGYVLQSGQLVLEGSARDLLNNPAVREAYLGQRSTNTDDILKERFRLSRNTILSGFQYQEELERPEHSRKGTL